jgi:OmcA/MtrC family decaheme c-type cytochrome
MLQRALLLLTAAAAVVLPQMGDLTQNRIDEDHAVTAPIYTESDKEFYLTAEQAQWIRPGLVIEVVSIEIPSDRHPVVVIEARDDLGEPLDMEGVITPGELDIRFILAWWDEAAREYTDYTLRPQTSPITGDTEQQPSYDSRGEWEELEIGRYQYTFDTQLPADYPTGMTHTLGIFATRDLRDIEPIEKRYVANVELDFVPDGSEVVDTWAPVSDANCNSCHDPLSAHGGSRQDVKLCVLCHTPQLVDPDTGRNLDMEIMTHKIHRGEDLPSVQAGEPYIVIGYRQSVHDYSNVAYPQDIRNCTSCHGPDNLEGHVWYTSPSGAECASCHDDVDFDTGEGHVAGPQPDSSCASCHQPEGPEYGPGIINAHTVPTKSEQLEGLNVDIVDVVDSCPGCMPTISFTVTNDAGDTVDPADLDRFSFLFGGPTTEITEYYRESLGEVTQSGDMFMTTLTTPIPADAEGTWLFSADVYRYVFIDDGSDEGLRVREATLNPIFNATVTDDTPVERREIVALDKCNACHDTLALHGGQRFKISECVICHTPLETDEAVRPADAGEPEGIHLKWLVHRLHQGEELTSDFTLYGFRSSVHNYNELRYPGDLRNCEACHVEDTYTLPLPDVAVATHRPNSPYFMDDMIRPATSTCISCHDTEHAAAHAYVNTAPFGESCSACHAEGREFSTTRLHAR